jgi:hypothetical protein
VRSDGPQRRRGKVRGGGPRRRRRRRPAVGGWPASGGLCARGRAGALVTGACQEQGGGTARAPHIDATPRTSDTCVGAAAAVDRRQNVVDGLKSPVPRDCLVLQLPLPRISGFISSFIFFVKKKSWLQFKCGRPGRRRCQP